MYCVGSVKGMSLNLVEKILVFKWRRVERWIHRVLNHVLFAFNGFSVVKKFSAFVGVEVVVVCLGAFLP